ncbi:hypothetical protein GM50_14595 [freshwater metagenome]|uniref:FMN-binding domain-containing protein n=1 Tax=freshwater metagenome TaxID=449393 RepID=A0A094PZ59_9ZZZZ
MKRALLIATGTVGGLGAVLAVTPPQFTSTENSSLAMAGIGAPAATATTQGAVPDATAATTTPSAKASAKSSTKPEGTTQTQTPAANTPVATPAQTTKSVSGTFTGDSVDVHYGFVQVKITVENGKITDAQAVQAPSGRNDRWTQRAVPILRQQTLEAQSANITGASGASFTSYGWYTSVASALAKAGL